MQASPVALHQSWQLLYAARQLQSVFPASVPTGEGSLAVLKPASPAAAGAQSVPRGDHRHTATPAQPGEGLGTGF